MVKYETILMRKYFKKKYFLEKMRGFKNKCYEGNECLTLLQQKLLLNY